MSFSDNAESKQSALDILFKKSVSIEANSAAEQFDKYVCDPSIPYNDDPFDWWKHHAGKFPASVPLAKKYKFNYNELNMNFNYKDIQDIKLNIKLNCNRKSDLVKL